VDLGFEYLKLLGHEQDNVDFGSMYIFNQEKKASSEKPPGLKSDGLG
jgi:hypothetical protein